VAKRKNRRKKNPSMGSFMGFIGGNIVGVGTTVAATMLLQPKTEVGQRIVGFGVSAAYFMAIHQGAFSSVSGDARTGALWAYGITGALSGLGLLRALSTASTPTITALPK
jgi:hypothetical protein